MRRKWRLIAAWTLMALATAALDVRWPAWRDPGPPAALVTVPVDYMAVPRNIREFAIYPVPDDCGPARKRYWMFDEACDPCLTYHETCAPIDF